MPTSIIETRRFASGIAQGILRILLPCIAVLAMGVSIGHGQQYTLRGEVIDASTGTAVANVTVILEGRSSILTGADGSFRLDGISRGRYTLTISRIGYETTELALPVFADTTVRVELQPAPIPLTPLDVRPVYGSIVGVVREASSGIRLIDADVFTSGGHRAQTNVAGRFALRRVPLGVPLEIDIEFLGYLPARIAFTPERDTTIVVELADDSVALRMIAAQVQRLDDRSAGRRYNVLPVLDRRDLLNESESGGSLADVLRKRLGSALYGRIACVVVDDSPIRRVQYETMLPDRVERVEILDVPGMRRQFMVRVYTRAFLRDMIRGQARLTPRNQVLRLNVSADLCR